MNIDIPDKDHSAMRAAFLSFWTEFKANKGALYGLIFIAILGVVAAFADMISPYSPIQQYRDTLKLPPAWVQGGDWAFLFGTDALGRDQLSRIIFGARYSFYIGFIVIFFCLTVGVFLGLIAAFNRGFIENVIMRTMDIILAFPSLLMALALVAILGPSLENAMIAIAIVYIPHFVRLTRAQALSELGKDYVSSSKTMGASTLRLMFINVLPNCLAPLIVQATMSFSSAILDAAALGFLGMGAQPPTPEWGTMLADSRQYILSDPWLMTIPGLFILLTVLSINLIGDGLRDGLDPKMKSNK
ncbi:MAG: ABC transporter permease subunit [Rhodobacteraceae bacterium]|jgi:dipeptide transport system permease protein|nr:ABC transporter permease subunit [Paracoccaceae bacterium]MBT6543956.1 ABC transporter permease subunit [Paracoccaceae bacterium]